MNEEQCKNLNKLLINYINSGKFSRQVNIEEIIKQLQALSRIQRKMLEANLREEIMDIYLPPPTSLPWYLKSIVEYGTDALQRACIIGLLVSIMIYNLQENKSLYTAAKIGLFSSTLTFFGSVLYDQVTNPTNKIERANFLLREIKKMESQERQQVPKFSWQM